MDFDLIIIGGGPGGYTGAIRAAQLGMKVAVVEKDPTLGGTCLNVGCIPSKALLDSSELYSDAKHKFAENGIIAKDVGLDIPRMIKRKDKIVGDLTKGIAFLFKKNKITHLSGLGSIPEKGTVMVTDANGAAKKYQAKSILIATGSVPAELPKVPFDGELIVSSTEALEFTKVPDHLIVVGGGVIGLELGSVWCRLGAKVTVVEFTENICARMDQALSKDLQKILTKQGMKFLMGSGVQTARIDGKLVTVSVQANASGKNFELTGDKVLVAVGRRPFSEGLGLEGLGVELDKRGFIQVNEHLETNVPGIFAIGDVVPGPMLAHKAEEEGVAVAEYLGTGVGHVNYETVPGVVYTWPELASVGKTEEELKAAGIAYLSGKFPFMANGRAKALNTTEGMVKVLADKTTDQVLGVHILGPRASDMIAEAVVAMEYKASSEDIARSFHAHPTLSEALREAALAVQGLSRQS